MGNDAVVFKSKGSWKRTVRFLDKIGLVHITTILEKYAKKGVEALRASTPKDTGLAATSWGYTIQRFNDSYSITWHNYDIEGGYNVAILLQYGHGTGNGGYITGRDYINPAMRPVFDQILNDLWKEVNGS